MTRLPTPGGDTGDWGLILNNFLAVEHNSDGTLKRAADIQSALKTIRFTQTWTIGGYINVAIGDVDYLNPIFVSAASGQTLKLVACRHRINSGTSATITIQRNGTGITGFTGITVTTSSTTTNPSDITLSDGDMLQLVVTGTSNSPQNMSVSLVFEITG